MLWLLILAPLVTTLAVAAAPRESARVISMLGALVLVGLGLGVAFAFDWADGASAQFVSAVPFLPAFGIDLSVGVDAIALSLILLTCLLQPLMVLGSFSSVHEGQSGKPVKTYYAWLSALAAPMVGVFAATDLLLFYVCFELTLVPMFILISLFGSTNRKHAAVKFFVYTFTGSILALAGLVYVAWRASGGLGEWTFEIAALAEFSRANLSSAEQGWVMLAMMAGFAVKVPLFPVHTWLPLAHTEAPTAGSVVLAGVLLKLGTYAILRFVLGFVPDAVVEWAWLVAILSIVGIVYAGLICWVQRDVKKLVAYSSVSHLGFCMLGLFALNSLGLAGSVLYMINHGLSTGALFFCIGMIYERYHTRSMDELGGLARRMPVWAFFMGFFVMASVGLPGLNGFVSEVLCLLGAFTSGAADIGVGGTPGTLGPWFAAIAGFGMVVAAIYLLYMTGKVVFGPLKEPAGHDHHDDGHARLPVDLSAREVAVLTPLAIGCIVLGLYPTPALEAFEAPIDRTLAPYELRLQDDRLSQAEQTPIALRPELTADLAAERWTDAVDASPTDRPAEVLR